ncbi:MAG: hypothetical protein V3T86_08625 [Planctomycetota bacterium]
MRWFATRSLIGGFVLFVLVGFGHSVWYELEVARFDAAIARIRAAGEPARFSEIENPPVPDDQNAYLVVREAVGILRRTEEQTLSGLARTYAWDDPDGPAPSPKEHAALVAFFEKLGGFFDLLEQVDRRPDWYESDPVGVEAIVTLQETYDYVLRRYEFTPKRSPTDTAIRGVELGWTLQARYAPRTILGWMVQLQFRRKCARAAIRMAGHPSVQAARLRDAVDTLLRGHDEAGPPRHLLVNERAYQCEYGEFELGRLGGRAYGERWNRATTWWSRPETVAWLADLLERSDAVFDRASSASNAEAVWARAQEFPRGSERGPNNGIAFSLLGGGLNYASETAAAIRLARLGIVLQLVRRERGAFPASLDALARYFPNGVPTDPFTRTAFVYERTDAGVLLKAGKPGATDEQLRWDDLLFALE